MVMTALIVVLPSNCCCGVFSAISWINAGVYQSFPCPHFLVCISGSQISHNSLSGQRKKLTTDY
jgi:hypothetical protein